MAKKQRAISNRKAAPGGRAGFWLMLGTGLVVACAAAVLFAQKNHGTAAIAKGASSGTNSVAAQSSQSPAAPVDLPTMPINQAVMVTVELDFGPAIPSIAEALRQVDRRYKPDDGRGRTFAILDAYGEPTSTGKLHMSMHVSSEKPGTGALVFRR